ncbi:MAG: YceI family protein [Massilia sp.]
MAVDRRRYACLLLAGALLTGCAERASAPPATQASAPGAAAWYRQARAAGSEVLTIDPAASLIAVTVRRAGPLARLGHDHVVASRTVSGFAAPREGRADFQFRLDEMTVDETALRREAGFDTTPDAEAIAGTRANMLTKVLESQRYPWVALHAQRVADDAGRMRLTITLHGVSREVTLPVAIEQTGAGVVATGSVQLRQSDFGITPMSVMGGAIRVDDTIELRFRLEAR